MVIPLYVLSTGKAVTDMPYSLPMGYFYQKVINLHTLICTVEALIFTVEHCF